MSLDISDEPALIETILRVSKNVWNFYSSYQVDIDQLGREERNETFRNLYA